MICAKNHMGPGKCCHSDDLIDYNDGDADMCQNPLHIGLRKRCKKSPASTPAEMRRPCAHFSAKGILVLGGPAKIQFKLLTFNILFEINNIFLSGVDLHKFNLNHLNLNII